MSDKPIDPMAAARRMARVELPRRFYGEAKAERRGEGYALLLDGRLAKTPAKKPLIVQKRAVAEALAAEWAAQGERLDPSKMPVTRIVNAAIDRIGEEQAAVRADIVKHAASDLLCYRAEGPQSLIDRQEALWSPLIAWAGETLGARFILSAGIVHVAQPERTLQAIEKAVAPFDPFELAALHSATTLSGSAIIALALARGRVTADAAWEAANLDEDWQMSQWGADEAAAALRKQRFNEFAAAALILSA
jgi:chaperone required for assembly of F1-ATPase